MAQSLGKNDDYGLNNRYMAEFKKEIKSKTRARLVECMNAPKLKPNLRNGFINDNIDLLNTLREEQGRKRHLESYFTKTHNAENINNKG